jgi:hypothetical protein
MLSIKCKKCGKEQDAEDYAWQNEKLGKRHPHCKSCQTLRSRKHYDTHKEEYLRKNRERRKQLVDENHTNILKYFKEHPCVDCGETHPATLQFDHVRGRKFKIVSMMIHDYQWDKLLIEIAKCEVRCGNCHAKKTAREYNWFTNV